MQWLRALHAQELGPTRIAAYALGFAIAAYAAWVLVPPNPIGMAIWIGAAVIGNDLILLPLYGLADHGILAALRRRGLGHWIGHIRVPVVLSGVLLLIFFPLMLDRTAYLVRWLLVTAGLFAISVVWLGIRVVYQRVRIRC